jgi:hypothetical protein
LSAEMQWTGLCLIDSESEEREPVSFQERERMAPPSPGDIRTPGSRLGGAVDGEFRSVGTDGS